MNLQKIMQDLGLSEKESKIYLALLRLRESLPSIISKKSEIKRPTTYLILDQLIQKGLVSHVEKGKITYFQAVNPRTLLEHQHNKYTALQKAIPELLSLHEAYSSTPQMSVFEGKEGIIKIMEDTLTAKTELLCWANVEKAVGYLKDYYQTYIRKKVKNKLWLRGILNDSSLAQRFKKTGKEELREVYLIPKEKFPFENEINIYDDKVAIISHDDKIGVIIQNKSIADTQRAIFNLGFEYAKILEKKNKFS